MGEFDKVGNGKKMSLVLEEVMEYRSSDGRQIAEDFIKLPSRKELPDYYKVIKNPMDFKKLKQGVKKGYKSWEEFNHDFDVMITNALYFNEPGSQIAKDAQKLKALFSIAYKKHRPKKKRKDPEKIITTTAKQKKNVQTPQSGKRKQSELLLKDVEQKAQKRVKKKKPDTTHESPKKQQKKKKGKQPASAGFILWALQKPQIDETPDSQRLSWLSLTPEERNVWSSRAKKRDKQDRYGRLFNPGAGNMAAHLNMLGLAFEQLQSENTSNSLEILLDGIVFSAPLLVGLFHNTLLPDQPPIRPVALGEPLLLPGIGQQMNLLSAEMPQRPKKNTTTPAMKIRNES